MNEKQRKYMREWMRNRLANNPEFRRKQNETSKLYHKTHPLSPEARVVKANYFKEWRRKNPEKVKAYTKKRMSTPRLQISQIRGRIRWLQKLLVKLEAQVNLEAQAKLLEEKQVERTQIGT